MCLWPTVFIFSLALGAVVVDAAVRVDVTGSVATKSLLRTGRRSEIRRALGADVADAAVRLDASGHVAKSYLRKPEGSSNIRWEVIQPDGDIEQNHEEGDEFNGGNEDESTLVKTLIRYLKHSKDRSPAHRSKYTVGSVSALAQPREQPFDDDGDEREGERQRQQQKEGPQNATLLLLTGVTGPIADMWTMALHANSPEAVLGAIMKEAGNYIQQRQLIMKEDECGDCEKIGIEQSRDCCVRVMQFGAVVHNSELLTKEQPIELSISLASEHGLSPELVGIMRNLGLSAGMYKKIGPHLRKKGIFKPGQLEGLDPSKLADEIGLPADDSLRTLLTNKLMEAISQAEAYRNSNGGNRTSLTALVKGEHWDVEQLIRRNGLFRGLRIANPGQDETNLQEAVQFKSGASLVTDKALETSILLQPDKKTSELNFESTKTYSLNSVNLMMESFGSSSLRTDSKSWSTNLGFDAGVVGIPVSFKMGFGSEDSTQRKEQAESKFHDEQMLNEKSDVYTKSRYFIEPRQMVVVDPAWLQATPALKNAFQKVKESFSGTNETKMYSVDLLFRDFGTHTCTRALLGGWWKIQATVKSTVKQKAMKLSTIVTSSIENLVEQSNFVNMQGNFFGASVGFENKEKSSTHDKETHNKRQVNNENIDTNNTMTDMSQEWKGGISGLQAEAWRASLDESMNSNWRIIDRFVDQCRGIWRWVDDDEDLKERICEGWRKGFMRDMAEHGVTAEFAEDNETEWASCKGAAYMQSFRSRMMDQRRAADEAKMKAIAIDCESSPGVHWDGSSCEQNVCKCGIHEGVVGAECPKHGAEKCKDEQYARCRTMHCPRGYWKKTSRADQQQKCKSHKCTQDDDLQKCCQPVYITDAFTIEVWTKRGFNCRKGGGPRVQWWLTGESGQRSHKYDIGDGPREGAFEDYAGKSGKMMKAKTICLKWTRPRWTIHHKWCVGEKIKIFNAHLPKSPESQIGEAVGWKKFYTPTKRKAKQCHGIAYKPAGG